MEANGITRRSFLVRGATGIALVACGGTAKQAQETRSAGAESEGRTSEGYIRGYEPGLAPAPAPSEARASATCDGHPTEDNIEGPFHKPDAPLRQGGLVETGTRGTRLVLSGRVLDIACKPLPGAELDVWHADHEGAYDNEGYGMRGRFRCDESGAFRIETIVPGRYLNGPQYRPAHIHVKVLLDGAERLTTQLYFEGDPYNDDDPFIRSSLIMSMDESGGAKRASFDFVVRA